MYLALLVPVSVISWEDHLHGVVWDTTVP